MRANYQRTPSGAYRRQLRHPLTGQKMSITAPSLAQLEIRCERVRRVREQLATGEIDHTMAMHALRTVQAGRVQTVRELWARYYPGISHRSRDSARSNWERRLEPYFGDLLLFQVTNERMRVWETKLREEGFAPKTIRGAYDNLAGAFRMAIDNREIQGYPWGGWRPRRAETVRPREGLASTDELARLVAAALEEDRELWARGRYADTYFMILVFALTGLRQREAAGLGWDFVEIDSAPHLLRVEYQAKRWWRSRWPEGRPKDGPKNGTRSQLLHPDAVMALRAQREQLQRFGWYRKNGPVFPGREGEWSECGVILPPERLRRIVARAGLANPADWTTHSLRHSFCTLEVQGSGGDLRTSMKRTGHRSIAVLQQYLHPRVHGAPPPAIPALAPALLPAVETTAELPGAPEPPRLPGVGRVDPVAIQREREAQVKRERGKSLDDAAREYVLDGAPARLPLAARAAFTRAYSRGYNRAKKAGKSPEECRAAGKRARDASRGAWAQAVARAKRVISAGEHPELPGAALGEPSDAAE